MKNLERIQEVATQEEIYIVNVAVRTVIDEFNNQSRENWKSITSFMEADEVNLIQDIQRRTWDKFGGAGMVLSNDIIETLKR